MTSLINKLSERDVWLEYLAHKRAKAQLTKREDAELVAFIESKAWLPIAEKLAASVAGRKASSAANTAERKTAAAASTTAEAGITDTSSTPDFGLGIPEKKLINKLGKSTKRVVYSFAPDEQRVLKLLAWLLYYYDDAHAPQCYSFRRGYSAHKAIRDLTRFPGIDSLYCYKMDIQDYFNSIKIDMLLPQLADLLGDDEPLYLLFESLLTADEALFEGQVLSEKRGVMAGTPTAPFLANLYLGEMDRALAKQAAAYARYSDDIIMFAETKEEIDELRRQAEEWLARFGLKSNADKEKLAPPGTAWEFLGMSYKLGIIDLSESTQRKLKGKIRRKARALRRWMLRKDATVERATAAMIRSMNRKFFERGSTHELTWSRWFFPLINTSESLGVIDTYLQQELRTIATGKHSKANYRMSYDQLKTLGYRSLVNEYYKFERDSSQDKTTQEKD